MSYLYAKLLRAFVVCVCPFLFRNLICVPTCIDLLYLTIWVVSFSWVVN